MVLHVYFITNKTFTLSSSQSISLRQQKSGILEKGKEGAGDNEAGGIVWVAHKQKRNLEAASFFFFIILTF